MEKALNQLTSEKRTEEERRREVEAQLVQMVRRTSVTSRPAEEQQSSSTAEESSADELLDPQLCRRLQQLLAKLHNEGLQVRNEHPRQGTRDAIVQVQLCTGFNEMP